jgi:hypothetical protein
LSSAAPLSLEETRRRLRELGYLDGRVERFLFRRAFEGRGGLFLPAILLCAFAAALASVAAVESSEPGFGSSIRPAVALLAHLFFANLLPALVAALVAVFLADRSRSPGGAATALDTASRSSSWRVGRGRLELAEITRARSLGTADRGGGARRGGSTRAGFSRAYARSHVLPSRRRGRSSWQRPVS